MHAKGGLTLIELSIALIIVGLIVGGVLVSADMMRVYEIRATLVQIEQYQSATDRFFRKFGALPGDMNSRVAATFGFTPRGALPGEGDGNRVIEGVGKGGATHDGTEETTGETAMFWVDLTTANGLNVNFIDGSFSTASPATYPDIGVWGITDASMPNLDAYLPAARLGNGNYIYVWSDGTYKKTYYGSSATRNNIPAPVNYFGLSVVTGIGGIGTRTAPGLTAAEAYSIDKKIDDGFPTTGNVTAQYITKNLSWAGPYGGERIAGDSQPIPATPATFATCYDNNNVTGGAFTYSLAPDKGKTLNCGLSFKLPSPVR